MSICIWKVQPSPLPFPPQGHLCVSKQASYRTPMKGGRGVLIDHKVQFINSSIKSKAIYIKKCIYINGVKQCVRNLCGNLNTIPQLPKKTMQSEDGAFIGSWLGMHPILDAPQLSRNGLHMCEVYYPMHRGPCYYLLGNSLRVNISSASIKAVITG